VFQTIEFTHFYGAFGRGVGFRALVDGRLVPCMVTGEALNAIAPELADTPLEQFRRNQELIHATARSLILAGHLKDGFLIIQAGCVKAAAENR